MILTCPECATSYFVEDGRIPPRGRTVRCTTCGHRWKATPDGQVELEPEPAPRVVGLAEEAPEIEADLVASPADDLEFVTAPITPPRKPKGAGRPPVLQALLGVAAILVVGGAGAAIVMRERVAQVVPGAARGFALIGLPVDTNGLVIEHPAFKAAFDAGQPVLVVTAEIHNLHDEPVEALPIRVSLLDKAKAPLTSRIFDTGHAEIPGRKRMYFSVRLPDPPADMKQLEIRFAPGAQAPAPAPTPAAPVPEAATALPDSHPDALKK